MAFIVRIWLRGPERIGHASIQLPNGKYISHWPMGGKGLSPKVPGTPLRTLAQDIIEEGGEPDHIFVIPAWINLDEDAIQTWWEVNKDKMHWTVFTNCCWMVKKVLIIGGIENHLKIQRVWINHPNNLLFLMLEITNLQSSGFLQEQTEIQEDWKNIILLYAIIDSTLTVFVIYSCAPKKSKGDDPHCLWILNADGVRKWHFKLQVLTMITVSQINPANHQHSAANAESKDKSLDLEERNCCDFQIEPICDCCCFRCSVFKSPTQTNCTLQTTSFKNNYKPGSWLCSVDLASLMSLMGDDSQDFSSLQIEIETIFDCLQYPTQRICASRTTSIKISKPSSRPYLAYGDNKQCFIPYVEVASIADNSQLSRIYQSNQNNQVLLQGDITPLITSEFFLVFLLVLLVLIFIPLIVWRLKKKLKRTTRLRSQHLNIFEDDNTIFNETEGVKTLIRVIYIPVSQKLGQQA